MRMKEITLPRTLPSIKLPIAGQLVKIRVNLLFIWGGVPYLEIFFKRDTTQRLLRVFQAELT